MKPSPTGPGPDVDAERLSLALAAARLGDWRWDPRTDEIRLSPRACEIFGFAEGATATRQDLHERIHPEDLAHVLGALDHALATRTDYSVEYRIRIGGRDAFVAASGRAHYDANGEVDAVIGVVQDLSRDRLLVKLDDTLRALSDPAAITFTAARMLGEYLGVDRCAYAFVEADEDTFVLTGDYTNGVPSIVGTYRFRSFGAQGLQMMRDNVPWVVADSATDPRLAPEERVAYESTTIRGVISAPIHKHGRFVAGMAVHTKAPRAWTASEVELVLRVAGRCWESIERARIEREREQLLEAAEAANRAKDEFLAMLGHELRNPLAPIVTALELMKLRGEASSARERAVVERQVHHLTRLVDDLLDVSRIARGRVELKHEAVEIADVVASALEVASPLLEKRAHRVEVEVPRGLVVDGDPARLTQVVANLLTNAAKYTPTGGHVAVTAEAAGDRVVLRVRDDGIGMTEEVRARAFDLFVQGRQAIDRAQGGLGLGLTIAKSLVERHGGTVVANSEGPDRGSELVVALPRLVRIPTDAPEAGPTSEAASDAPARTLGVRLLLVDDNVDAAELLAAALEAMGATVRVAHDGAEALRLAGELPLDAALLDIGLPVMDGYELAARLRALPATATMKLVALTGYGQEADRARALAAGFDDHLVKPVALDAVERVLRALRTGA